MACLLDRVAPSHSAFVEGRPMVVVAPAARGPRANLSPKGLGARRVMPMAVGQAPTPCCKVVLPAAPEGRRGALARRAARQGKAGLAGHRALPVRKG